MTIIKNKPQIIDNYYYQGGRRFLYSQKTLNKFQLWGMHKFQDVMIYI